MISAEIASLVASPCHFFIQDVSGLLTAEERLKDKIAVAARDKLAASTKEKQLQAERKKKAALFINLLRIVKESPMTEDNSKEEGDAGT